VKTKRALIITLLCLAGLAIVVGAAVAITQQHAQITRGVFFGFPAPIDPPKRGIGVNVALEQYDEAQLKAELAQIKQAGFSWIRQTFPWAQIEPEQGQFEWAKWDLIVQNSGDLNLIAVLDTAPLWAASSNFSPPTSTLQFANFARSLAQRYGDRIGLLGGIDLDILCVKTPDEVYDIVLERGREYRRLARGYALGSGNSIPDYVPVDGYLAMIRAAQAIRAGELN